MRSFATLTPHEQKVVNTYLFTKQRAEIQAVLLRADLERLALTFGEEEIELASCILDIHQAMQGSEIPEWRVMMLPKRKEVK
jgi:hypothetical protein